MPGSPTGKPVLAHATLGDSPRRFRDVPQPHGVCLLGVCPSPDGSRLVHDRPGQPMIGDLNLTGEYFPFPVALYGAG